MPWLTVGWGHGERPGQQTPSYFSQGSSPYTCCIHWTSRPGGLHTKGSTVPNGLKTSLWQCAPSGPEKVLSHRLLPALCLSASPESSRGGGCRLGETCPYPELPERCRDGRTGTGGWSADSGRGLLCPPAVLERVGACACVCTCGMSVCICVFRLHVPLYMCGLVCCLCVYARICVSVYGNICSLCVCLCVCVSVCECVLRLSPALGVRTQPRLASP